MRIDKAHSLCQQAIKKGQLVRPEHCFLCEIKCKPIGHHFDYDKPLEVIWVCKKCHRLIHRVLGKGKNHDGKTGAQIYIDSKTKRRLDKLCEKDQRAITDEIKFLIGKREAELKK